MDARESLTQLAARAGARTRPANLIARSGWDYFTVRSTFKSGGIRIDAFANSSQLYIILRGDFGVVFATPHKDPVLNLNMPLGQVGGLDVYVNDEGGASPVPWIYSRSAVAAVESLDLTDDELLSVALNGVTAILRSTGPDADWDRLKRLMALARVLPRGAKEAPLDPQRIPEDLRDLIPMIKRWRGSDDQERSDKIGRAKTATLRALVDRVESRLSRISEFLKESGGDTAEASALDGLAQSVMEARLELNRRA